MNKTLKWKIIIVMLVTALSCYEIAANPLKLGMDIQGGTHFTLQVDTDNLPDSRREEAADQAVKILRNRIDEIGIAGTSVQIASNERIIIQVPGMEPKDVKRVKDIILRQAHLEFRLVVDEPSLL